MEKVSLQGVGVRVSTISSMQNCARLLSVEKQLEKQHIEKAFLLSVNSPCVCVCVIVLNHQKHKVRNKEK